MWRSGVSDVSLIGMSQLAFDVPREGCSAPSTPDDHSSWPAHVSTTAAFQLTHDNAVESAGGYGVGWTLTAYDQGRWCWSMSLASRGAAVSARARVAQAVAVRVLAEQGVAVHGWVVDSAEDDSPMFRAWLRHSSSAGPVLPASTTA